MQRPAKVASARRTQIKNEETRPRRKRKASIPFASSGRKPVRSSSSPPPVLVRNASMAVPSKGKNNVKHRRRYDVALSVPGAEVRLPSLPQIQIGWRILSFMMVIALGGLLAFLWTSPMFVVEAAGLGGAQRVSSEELNTVVGVAGESIFSIDPAEIYTDVARAFPEMSAVTVEVKLPAFISITVSERQPLVSWQAEGKELWVDAEGVAFPPRGQGGDLAVVHSQSPLPEELKAGTTADHLIQPEMVTAILEMRGHVPEGSALVYENDHGFGWQDGRGWQVFFGRDTNNMEMKLQVYSELVARLEREGITPNLISVEYVHAPYYRVEP